MEALHTLKIRNQNDEKTFKHVCVNEFKRLVNNVGHEDLVKIAQVLFAADASTVKNAILGVGYGKN